jgi:hypothetical protein
MRSLLVITLLLLSSCLICTIGTTDGQVNHVNQNYLSQQPIVPKIVPKIVPITELKKIVFTGDQLICNGGTAKELNHTVESITIGVTNLQDNLAIGYNRNVFIKVNTFNNTDPMLTIYDYSLGFDSSTSNHTHLDVSTAKLYYKLQEDQSMEFTNYIVIPSIILLTVLGVVYFAFTKVIF